MINHKKDYIEFPNLEIRSVKYGFGWHEKINPSSDCIENVLDRLDDRLQGLNQKIKDAEEVLSFYGDIKNWRKQNQKNFTIASAFDVEHEQLSERNLKANFGGKRARDYFDKYRIK